MATTEIGISDELPGPDQYELSLIGPGYGESVVIHAGNGEWIVVDSCRRTTVASAPLKYLTDLGVKVDQSVARIVASHWHDDHVGGLSELYAACASATFVISSALRTNEFLTLVSRSERSTSGYGSALDEFRRVIEESDRRVRDDPGQEHVKLALENTVIYRNGVATLESLSPSATAVRIGLERISDLIPDLGDPLKRPSLSQNDACVVLQFAAAGVSVLLGADLEFRQEITRGWNAVLAARAAYGDRSSIYKVAHHGSQNGHHAGIWSDLLEPSPISILTPFIRGKVALPTMEDKARIWALSRSSYSTVASPRRKTLNRSHTVDKIVGDVTRSLSVAEPEMGQIQIRWHDNNDIAVRLSQTAGSLISEVRR